MIRKAPFYKILSAIHVVFFTSILCFGIIFLSGTLLMLPALGAVFKIGKDVLYDELDITNSIVVTFLCYFKDALCLMCFVPMNIMIILNIAGIWGALQTGITWILLMSLVIISLLLTVSVYIAGYFAFVERKFSLEKVAVAGLIKPLSVITIFGIMTMFTYFFSGILATIMIFIGTFFLFVIEIVIFITMLYYLRMTGQLEEENKYAYLVNGKK